MILLLLLPLLKPIEEPTRKLGYYVSVLASIVVDILGRFFVVGMCILKGHDTCVVAFSLKLQAVLCDATTRASPCYCVHYE